jgi:MFS family permease
MARDLEADVLMTELPPGSLISALAAGRRLQPAAVPDHGGDLFVLGVVIPAMVPELGWSWEHAFLGFTILGVFTGLSSWLPALLIRRIGVRGAVLVGVAVMAGGLACLSRVHALPIYFVGTALCGIGFQMAALIPGTHVLSAIFKERALPFGIYFTFGALGGVAGPWMVVSALGATHNDWRLYWALQAAVVGLVGLVCAVAVGGPRWLEQAGAALDATSTPRPRRRAPRTPSRHGSTTPTTNGASATRCAPRSSTCCWPPISATCWRGSAPPA